MQIRNFALCLVLLALAVTVPVDITEYFPLHASPAVAATQQGTVATPPQTNAEVTAKVAGLSDEEARKLLIQELEKSTRPATPVEQLPGSTLGDILNSLSSKSDASEEGTRNLLNAIPGSFPDLHRVFLMLCPYGTANGAMENIFWVLFYLALGFFIEQLFYRLVINKLFLPLSTNGLPKALSGVDKAISCLVREIPSVLRILIFFGGSYLIYVSFIWTDSPHVQLFFLAILLSITTIRIIAIVARTLFSPRDAVFRLLPMNDRLARTANNTLLLTFGYILTVLMFGVVLRKLGALDSTIKIFFMLSATLLLGGTAVCALIYKNQVRDAIILAPNAYGGNISWGRKQFAAIWHLLAIAYLVILWILLFSDMIDPDTKKRGAFILSFFIAPIWMVCDKLLQWLVKYTVATLKIYDDQAGEAENLSEEEQLQREHGKATFLKTMNISRTALVVILLVWIASLWDIYIPVFSHLSSVLFDTLIILTLAIFFWQFISNWIERKIEEATPSEAENKEDEDEWGAAATRGRSYTLLPMLRKFIGTILITMVTMTILSSMGVDIGPLLAGAGVVGLAVGFGAQKLVADMFSGFFYLLDDAFRVGEYIEAGGITGTVENISLRNVMLRHHRGMLQIVPHSELGAITNYMRGGIIVKFNLDFPYDADIDKIRKIIKKVGQAMIEEEEFKDDFIRPVKSQGVREITNSVMTIRVKFTAKPGAHFLIRREAYKRITEALRDKGINYAHRKVIVDIPQQGTAADEQVAQAAGAAAQEILAAENGADASETK